MPAAAPTAPVVAVGPDFASVAGRACSGAASAGWCWQQPLPQGNAIADTTFVDDSHGWAVGDAGSVLATADGGLTWSGQSSGTPLALAKVRFVDARIGWVAGSYGEVLRTTDGGTTWQRSSFGRNDAVQDFGAADANAAWLTTFSNEGYVTHDGGVSWRKVPPAPQGTFKLAFAGVDDVWSLASFFTAQPMLAHSLDGAALEVAEPARTSLKQGAEIRRHAHEIPLDTSAARNVHKTWAALDKLATARVRLEKSQSRNNAVNADRAEGSYREPAPAPTAAQSVVAMVDQRIADHVKALSRAYAAVDTARAAAVGLDDVALKGALTVGDSLEDASKAMVEVK